MHADGLNLISIRLRKHFPDGHDANKQGGHPIHLTATWDLRPRLAPDIAAIQEMRNFAG